MIRVALAVFTFVCLLSPVTASLSQPQELPGFVKNPPLQLVKDQSGRDQNSDYVINEKTEVKLDGQMCKYEDVPASAEIILLEVVSNKDRTIVKIHFRSKK